MRIGEENRTKVKVSLVIKWKWHSDQLREKDDTSQFCSSYSFRKKARSGKTGKLSLKFRFCLKVFLLVSVRPSVCVHLVWLEKTKKNRQTDFKWVVKQTFVSKSQHQHSAVNVNWHMVVMVVVIHFGLAVRYQNLFQTTNSFSKSKKRNKRNKSMANGNGHYKIISVASGPHLSLPFRSVCHLICPIHNPQLDLVINKYWT